MHVIIVESALHIKVTHLNIWVHILGKITLCVIIVLRMWSIKIYQQIHTGEKPFYVIIVERGFQHKINLLNHQSTHSGEELFVWITVTRALLKKCDLLRHQRMHTGEKPFLCDHCGKNFAQKSYLLIYQRMHTGENISKYFFQEKTI